MKRAIIVAVLAVLALAGPAFAQVIITQPTLPPPGPVVIPTDPYSPVVIPLKPDLLELVLLPAPAAADEAPAAPSPAPPAAVASATPVLPSLPGIIDPSGAINWWLLVGTVGTVLWTNVAMIFLKKAFPGWQSKGWAPPIIGLVTAVLGAAATGQIHSIPTLLAWIIGGLGAGASASSLRDFAVGK
jgi:hypothetical protein